MNYKIAFFDTKSYDREMFEKVNENYGFKIKFFKGRLNEDTAVLTKGYDAVCAFVNDTINKEVIRILNDHNIKLIALRCAGYNNVDLKYAYDKLHTVRVPAYSPYAVAEHGVALIMSLNRKIHKAYSRTRDNNFNISGFTGFDMFGKTAGVIGTGKIGKIMISILRGFGMRVLCYDLYPDQKFAEKNGCEYANLEEIYRESDIISLHCPLTSESHHMINKETIGLMKDNVMIINTSRGGLIDSASLIEALKSRKIGSAGLDVYEEESDFFFEDFSNEILPDDILARLLTFPNVLITSHQAFLTREALQNIAETTLDNIKEAFQEGKYPNEVCYKCDKKPCARDEQGKCF